MKIALIAPAEESIPPKKYGGTELVVANLAAGLVERGHDVHVYGAAGSQVAGTFHPIFEKPVREALEEKGELENFSLRLALNFVSIARGLEQMQNEQFDIIHNHINWRLITLQKLLHVPILTTWHTAMEEQFMRVVNEYYQDAPCTSISNNQRKAYPHLNYLATVYNGIDVNAFSYNPTPQDYIAFLGRISPDKGLKEAIQAVKKAGKKLIIAAKLDGVDMQYYEEEVKPYIDGEQIVYLGEVDHAGKVELLRNAQATIGLIQWEEPFGLFIVESLACGTPVIAVNRGSVPEIIRDGVTGYIVGNTIDEAVTALAKVDQLDRAACRADAENRFSRAKMAAEYEAVYQQLLQK